MGIDHGRRNVTVPQEFLDCPDVIVCLQQMSGKGMAESVHAHGFGYTRQSCRLFDRLLDNVLIHMMPSDRVRSRILGQSLRRKGVLPTELLARVRVFPL